MSLRFKDKTATFVGVAWTDLLGGILIEQRDETLGASHVAAILFAQCSEQCLFLDMDAPKNDGATGHKDEQDGGPVLKTQAETDCGEQAASITWMPDKMIWAGINQAVIIGNGDIHREKAPQMNDRIPTQSQTRNKEATAKANE